MIPRQVRRPGLRQSLHHNALRQLHTLNNKALLISPEVQHALSSGIPVVALESALITHGLPFPINYQTATSLEKIVRSTGCIPATVGLLSGQMHVGLSESELQQLSDTSVSPAMVKISRRDLGPAIALKRSGGTTISGTMIVAHAAGIRFFGTGGLGGVHRGGESTFDISADLTELARTPIAVVSSGVKAILDIGRTLEYLETQGVPVITFGPTNDFPAFYSRTSGFKSPWRVDSPSEAANIVYRNQAFDLKCGTLFAVPIPTAHEKSASRIQQAVEKAIQESISNGMSKKGNDVTPWLLQRVADLSMGEAIQSNIALLENNVRVAGEIAAAYSSLAQARGDPEQSKTSVISPVYTQGAIVDKSHGDGMPRRPPSVAVVGSAAVDITARLREAENFSVGSTTPGSVSMSLGGVARNVAEALHFLLAGSASEINDETMLISPVAKDALASVVKNGLKDSGQRLDGLLERSGDLARTAVCNLVLDSEGHLVGGIADMGITELLTPEEITATLGVHKPTLVGFDANISSVTMSAILRFCHESNAKAFFEPTSVAKCTRILDSLLPQSRAETPLLLSYMSPNVSELQIMYDGARSQGLFSSDRWWNIVESMSLSERYRSDIDMLCRQHVNDASPQVGDLSFLVQTGLIQMTTHFLPFVRGIFLKLGANGALFAGCVDQETAIARGWHVLQSDPDRRLVVAHGRSGTTLLRHFPAVAIPDGTTINSTGAGDSFVGGLLAGLLRTESDLSLDNLDETVQLALQCAALTLRSDRAVAPEIRSLGRASVFINGKGVHGSIR